MEKGERENGVLLWNGCRGEGVRFLVEKKLAVGGVMKTP